MPKFWTLLNSIGSSDVFNTGNVTLYSGPADVSFYDVTTAPFSPASNVNDGTKVINQ